jgi:hypothetical protein
MAMNISTSGILLRSPEAHALNLHEEVTVDIDLDSHSDRALSTWGIGRIVRQGNGYTALRLVAGRFRDTANPGL